MVRRISIEGALTKCVPQTKRQEDIGTKRQEKDTGATKGQLQFLSGGENGANQRERKEKGAATENFYVNETAKRREG